MRWSTYFGGDQNGDAIWGIAIDAASAVYVTGQTTSDDFPVTSGAFSTHLGGSDDGFVAKLLPEGTGLVWSTYFGSTCCGGGGSEYDVAVDTAGNAWTVGDANEPVFPTTPDAFQPNYTGPFPSADSHLTKFDALGESLVYSSWYAGSNTDYFGYIDLDGGQEPHIAIVSYSSNIPVTAGAYDTSFNGNADMVVAKFDLPLLPWQVLGGGKKGAMDHPNLAGKGALTPGSPGRLAVRGAAKNSSALLFAGLTAINAPILGGVFVPSPQILLSLTTDAAGGLDLPFVWPLIPLGIDLYVQVWVADAGATLGYSATNGLKLTSQ